MSRPWKVFIVGNIIGLWISMFALFYLTDLNIKTLNVHTNAIVTLLELELGVDSIPVDNGSREI